MPDPEKEPSAVAIDHNALHSLRSMLGSQAETMLPELVATFCETTQSLIDDIERALPATSAEPIYRAAHSIKSNALTLGATALAQAARELELMGKADQLDRAAESLALIQREYKRAEEALATILQEY